MFGHRHMTDSQRRAMFARRAGLPGSFPLKGDSRRAHRNRAIVGSVALGGLLAGGIAAKRLIPALTKETGSWLMKDGKGGTVRIFRGIRGMADVSPEERRAAEMPFIGKAVKRAIGGQDGSDELSTVPWTVRKYRSVLEAARNRTAGIVENRTKLLNALGTKGGVSRVVLGIEAAERKAKELAARPVTMARQAMLDHPIPSRELKQAIRENAAKDAARYRTTRQAALAALHETLTDDQARDLAVVMKTAQNRHGGKIPVGFDPMKALANDQVRQLLRTESELGLYGKYPSRAERLSEGITNVVARPVKRLNRKLNESAIAAARRAGLPIDEVWSEAKARKKA